VIISISAAIFAAIFEIVGSSLTATKSNLAVTHTPPARCGPGSQLAARHLLREVLVCTCMMHRNASDDTVPQSLYVYSESLTSTSTSSTIIIVVLSIVAVQRRTSLQNKI
jgi:hypothetical protein